MGKTDMTNYYVRKQEYVKGRLREESGERFFLIPSYLMTEFKQRVYK